MGLYERLQGTPVPPPKHYLPAMEINTTKLLADAGGDLGGSVDLYVYRARLERVVDGDTFDLHIDPGFHLNYAARVRLHGIDCPETRRGSEFEKERGREATAQAEHWFEEVARRGADIIVRTHKDDSFGRWLADVTASDVPVSGWTLAQHLKHLDLAVDWPARWRDVYDNEESP